MEGEKEGERERKKNEVEGAPRFRLGCGIIHKGGEGKRGKEGTQKSGQKKTLVKSGIDKNVKDFSKFFFFSNSRS